MRHLLRSAIISVICVLVLQVQQAVTQAYSGACSTPQVSNPTPRPDCATPPAQFEAPVPIAANRREKEQQTIQTSASVNETGYKLLDTSDQQGKLDPNSYLNSYYAHTDTVGVYRPSNGTFYLNAVNTGPYGTFAQVNFTGTFGSGNFYPITGDWIGDYFDRVGLYDENTAIFYLKTSNLPNSSVFAFQFGAAGDQPVSGRWTSGATQDGIGIYRSSNGLILLRNTLSSGSADFTMVLGSPGDVGVFGDWNGDGIKSVGIYRPSAATFYLSDTVCDGCSVTVNYAFNYGSPNGAPIAGDWSAQGHFGVGLYNTNSITFYLKNSLSVAADINPIPPFQEGIPGDIPLAGRWGSVIPPSPTPTSTYTPSKTFTPTYTYTPSKTFTPTNTATFTPSKTFTATYTFTPSKTFTPTFTYTPNKTFTPSNTPTYTPSKAFTPTFTYTPSKTFTPSNTPLPTPTFTPTYTFTPSITATFTPSNTPLPTATFTPSIPPTPTATFTPSVTPDVLNQATLTLSPPGAGPNIPGTSQTMSAQLLGPGSTPLGGYTVQFTVTGANPTTGSKATDLTGTATFTYTGANGGTDSVVANVSSGTHSLTSTPSSVIWTSPSNPISTTTIFGRFFTNCGTSEAFDKTKDDIAVFTETFPNLNFNPLDNTIPNAPSIPSNTAPIVDFVTDVNGAYSGQIVAQGRGYVPQGQGGRRSECSGAYTISSNVIYGAGSRTGDTTLQAFEAVFTGEFIVSAKSTLNLGVYHDDGFAWGVGPDSNNQSPSGTTQGGNTVFLNYPIINAQAGYNNGFVQAVINFPEAGIYPYEIDWAENGIGGQGFSVLQANNKAIPQSSSLTISPSSIAIPPTAGTSETFTVTAQDVSGTLLKQQLVSLMVQGANAQQQTASTNNNGIATFTYTGTNPGTDVVQAVAWLNNSSIPSYSASVTIPWAGLPNPCGSTPTQLAQLTSPGWLDGSTLQNAVTGAVSINLQTGFALDTGKSRIDYWPADLPGSTPTTLNFSANQGTIANLDTTLLANDAYIVRLCGTSADDTQQVNSGVLVKVVGNYKPGRVRFSITDLTVPVAGIPITIGRTYDSLERGRSGDFGYGWSLNVGSPRLEVSPSHDVTLTQPNGRRVTYFFTPKPYGYGPINVFGFLQMPAYTPEAGVYGSLQAEGCSLLAVSGGQDFCFPGQAYQPTVYDYTDPYGRLFRYSVSVDGSGNQTSSLISARDLSGNTLVYNYNTGISSYGVNSDGSTSTVARLSVTWQRDSAHQGRITQIMVTDNVSVPNVTYTYSYGYDPVTGDLTGVTFPPTQTGTPVLGYAYYDTSKCATCAHLFKNATDPQNHQNIIIDDYTTDGRLLSETMGMGAADDPSLTNTHKFTYAYNMTSSPPTTTVTNPDGGVVISSFDPYGMIVSKIETVDLITSRQRTTNYQYYPDTDAVRAHHLMTQQVQGMSGSPVTYDYDSNGFQKSVTDEGGYTSTSQYNSQGGLMLKIDAESHQQSVSYGSHGFDRYLPVSITDETGAFYGGYDWNVDGTIQARYDGNGETTHNKTSYSYDIYGNLVSEQDPVHPATTYKYNTLAQLQTVYSPLSGQTDYTYDGLGHTTSVKNRLNGSTSYTYQYQYDLNGNKTDARDPRSTGSGSYDTSYLYDALNHLQKVNYPPQTNYPGGTSVTYSYDWRGHKTKEIDQASHLTCYSYDGVGRLTKTTYGLMSTDSCPIIGAATPTPTATPTGAVSVVASVSYTYDDADHKLSETDGRGNTTTYTYYPNGTLYTVNHPNPTAPGSVYTFETYVYYKNGWPQTATDAGLAGNNGHAISYLYNARGQVTSTQYTGNSTSETRAYDASGNLLQITDQNGAATYYTYDAANQLKSVVKPFVRGADPTTCGSLPTPTCQWTQYGYDDRGNLNLITDGNGHKTSFAYDALGRQTQKTWPAASGNSAIAYEMFGYDAVGNMTSHQLSDDVAHINTYQYDALNRQTHIGYFDGTPSADFDYTATGQRWHVKLNGALYATYTYDTRDRLTQIQHADGQAVGYTYDQNNNRTELDVTSGGTTNSTFYNYDVDNRLKTLTNNSLLGAGATVSYDYYTNNLRQDLNYPNGITTNYGYDALNHLTSINQTGSAGSIASYQYTLDKAGNRTQVQETNGATINNIYWCYDDAMRLTAEWRNSNCNPGSGTPTPTATPSANLTRTNYAYDAVGNRLSKTTDGQTITYSYNALDQLTNDSTGATYSYDGRGNQKTVVGAGVTTIYGWDAADRLAVVTKTGTTTLNASYSYDADGRRVQVTNGSATNYLWDEASAFGNIVTETTGNNTLQGSYLVNGTDLVAQTRIGTLIYYLFDGQNSVRILTNGTGIVTDAYSYDAYGNANAYGTSGSTVNPYRYTNQQTDTTTGLYNLRARYYDPHNGIFLSRDTINLPLYLPSQLNTYIYATNNPVNLIDPSGHDAEFEYSAQNANSSEESAPVESFGQGTTELYGRQLASEEVGEAQSIYSSYFTPGDQITVGKGTYVDVEGTLHNFAGTNDFYGNIGKNLFTKVQNSGISNDFSEFLGPTLNANNQGAIFHVEFKAITYIKSILGELSDNSIITFGVSHPGGICLECGAKLLADYGAQRIGGQFIITLGRGITMILAGIQ